VGDGARSKKWPMPWSLRRFIGGQCWLSASSSGCQGTRNSVDLVPEDNFVASPVIIQKHERGLGVVMGRSPTWLVLVLPLSGLHLSGDEGGSWGIARDEADFREIASPAAMLKQGVAEEEDTIKEAQELPKMVDYLPKKFWIQLVWCMILLDYLSKFWLAVKQGGGAEDVSCRRQGSAKEDS